MRWRALRSDIYSATALGFIGDIVCQLGPEGKRMPQTLLAKHTPDDESFSLRRLGAITLYDGVYVGGFLHFLYQGYPLVVRAAARSVRWLPRKALIEGSFASGLGCALVDNVHNGLLYVPTFFVGVGLLQGDSLENVQSTLRREWLETYVYCTGFWLPFTALNFSLVPPAARVRTMATANLLWNVVIDWLAHRGVSPPEEPL